MVVKYLKTTLSRETRHRLYSGGSSRLFGASRARVSDVLGKCVQAWTSWQRSVMSVVPGARARSRGAGMTPDSDDLEQALRRNLELRRELGAEVAKGMGLNPPNSAAG